MKIAPAGLVFPGIMRYGVHTARDV